MASEPEVLVCNIQSCSHEKELFVLLLQTEEKMGSVSTVKRPAHPELNQVFGSGRII